MRRLLLRGRAVRGALAPLLAVALGACGGGGGGGDGPGSTAPTITAGPSDLSVEAGTAATFTVTATGTAPLAYRWASSPDGLAWSDLAGATAATYTVLAPTVGQTNTRFRVTVTNGAGSATSGAAQLTVTPFVVPPSITSEPADVTAVESERAGFTVVAAGTSPSYAWSVSTDGGATWTAVPGAAAATFEIPEVELAQSGHRFRVRVSNTKAFVDSAAATLTVHTLPRVTRSPAPTTVDVGETASFEAEGDGIPAPTVQWQKSTDGGTTWDDVPGAAATALVTAATVAGDTCTQYRAVFTNAAGTATSDPGLLGVEPVPVIPAYEPFEYAAGANLAGQSGGAGFSSGWTVTQTGPSSVVTGASSGTVVEGLRYVDEAGNTLVTAGGAWATSAALFYGQAQRPTASTAGTACTSRWSSFLVRHATATTGIDYAMFTLGTGYTFGSQAMIAGVGPTYVATGCFYCSSGGASKPIPGFGAGVVALILVRTDFAAAGNDTISAWANPPLGVALGPPDASSSSRNYAATISGLSLPWGDNRSFTFDEVRTGRTAASVLPYTPGP